MSLKTEMVEQKIASALGQSNAAVDRDASFAQDLEDVINQSLSRLHVIRCSSLTCALATMPRVDKLLATNRRTSLLIVDSINAFYNSLDFGETRRFFNSFVSSLCRFTDVYKVTIFAAKSALFPKDCSYQDARTGRTLLKHSEYLGKHWTDSVRFRLIFCTEVSLGSKRHLLVKETGFEKQEICTFNILKAGIDLSVL